MTSMRRSSCWWGVAAMEVVESGIRRDAGSGFSADTSGRLIKKNGKSSYHA